MASFTWTQTATPGTYSWGTESNWNPSNPGFNNLADTYTITTSSSLALTITGASGSVGSLLIDDAGANVEFGESGAHFGTGLTLNNGTITALGNNAAFTVGTGAAAAAVTVGDTSGSAATLSIGSLDDNDTYSINTDGNTLASISLTGFGTILASGGYADIGRGITINGSLNFQLANNAGNEPILDFDDTVNSGSISFLGSTGILYLDGTQIGNGTDLSNQTFGATIAGLTVGSGFTNGIDIADGSDVVSATLSGFNNDTLTVMDNNGSTVTFGLTGDYLGDTAAVRTDTVARSGFDVFIMVCFAAGTAVLAKHGEIAVETIRPGDQIMTLVDGAYVPRTVKWVGQRDIDLTRHPKRAEAAPVRIARGALGDNLPRRDLLLSGDHCLFIDGRLYPAKLLINDMTITRELTAKSVSYYHVELEQHAVMVVEGVAAESYLDTGNRAFFSNAGVAMMLHPEFTINEALRCWETDACAPLTMRPELVKPVWQRFVDRAVALGHAPSVHTTTDDAAIHLLVDGAIVRPLVSTGGKVSFMLPATAKSIRLVSRATRQSSLMPWLDDPRTLGVAIRSVTLRDQAGESVIGADHPGLRDGWHAAERGADGALWRWSAGNAALPVRVAMPCMLEIALSDTATYIADARRLAA
jgi:antigen 43